MQHKQGWRGRGTPGTGKRPEGLALKEAPQSPDVAEGGGSSNLVGLMAWGWTQFIQEVLGHQVQVSCRKLSKEEQDWTDLAVLM